MANLQATTESKPEPEVVVAATKAKPEVEPTPEKAPETAEAELNLDPSVDELC